MRDPELERIEREIWEERAAALGRIGQRLQALSNELAILWTRWCQGDRSVVAQYDQRRREFLQYLWFWYVQREVNGFRLHPRPETWLFIPPPLRESPKKPK